MIALSAKITNLKKQLVLSKRLTNTKESNKPKIKEDKKEDKNKKDKKEEQEKQCW